MSNRLQSLISAGGGSIKKIGVVGMGYVGIPAAVLFADAPPEFESVLGGFQRASASSGYKIDMLNRGESPSRARSRGGLKTFLQRLSMRGGSSSVPRTSRRSRGGAMR